MELLQFNITVVMTWNNQITGVEVYLMAQPKVQFEGWILQPSIPWYIFDKLGTYSRFGAILISTLAMHCVSSWDTETINYNRYISPCCELIVHNFFSILTVAINQEVNGRYRFTICGASTYPSNFNRIVAQRILSWSKLHCFFQADCLPAPIYSEVIDLSLYLSQ